MPTKASIAYDRMTDRELFVLANRELARLKPDESRYAFLNERYFAWVRLEGVLRELAVRGGSQLSML